MVKPGTCNGCALASKGDGFVLPAIPNWSEIKLLVCGEAPGSNEVDDGKPFVGKAGQQMRMILKHCSIDPEKVFYDNVLRCLPPPDKNGDHYPTGKERAAAEQKCAQYDTFALAPKHIPLLLVGGKALKKWQGHDNISQWHGNIVMIDGRLVGATYHPSAVLRNLNLITVTVQETQNLLDAAKNPAMILWRPKVWCIR